MRLLEDTNVAKPGGEKQPIESDIKSGKICHPNHACSSTQPVYLALPVSATSDHMITCSSTAPPHPQDPSTTPQPPPEFTSSAVTSSLQPLPPSSHPLKSSERCRASLGVSIKRTQTIPRCCECHIARALLIEAERRANFLDEGWITGRRSFPALARRWSPRC